jgi:cell wall assembly regulator SMI1
MTSPTEPIPVAEAYRQLSIREMWSQTERWLASIPGGYADRLAGPATEGDISALLDAVGGWLPDEYLESLRCHGGNVVETSTTTGLRYPVDLITDVIWLAPELIHQEREFLKAYERPLGPHDRSWPCIRPMFYGPGWIPVVRGDSDRALYWCIDTVPPDPAHRGQIIAMLTNDPDREYAFTSYRSMFANLILERLAWPMDPDALDEGVIQFLSPDE